MEKYKLATFRGTQGVSRFCQYHMDLFKKEIRAFICSVRPHLDWDSLIWLIQYKIQFFQQTKLTLKTQITQRPKVKDIILSICEGSMVQGLLLSYYYPNNCPLSRHNDSIHVQQHLPSKTFPMVYTNPLQRVLLKNLYKTAAHNMRPCNNSRNKTG